MLPFSVKKDSGWNWNPYILFWLSSRPIGIFVLLHLIVILIEFDLNGSINFNEWYLPTLNCWLFLKILLWWFVSRSVHQFLKIKFNTKALTNRTRTYFFYKLDKKLKEKILLKEGKSYHFYGVKKIKFIKFVPWDLAAILYYHFNILKKEQIKPKK